MIARLAACSSTSAGSVRSLTLRTHGREEDLLVGASHAHPYYAGDPAVVAGFNNFAARWTGGDLGRAMEFVADSVCTGWGMCSSSTWRYYVDPPPEMVADAMALVR